VSSTSIRLSTTTEQDDRASRRLLTGFDRRAGVAPRGQRLLRRGEAQRDHGACRAGEAVARAAPLLRLAANGRSGGRHIAASFLKGSTGLLTPRASRAAVTPPERTASWWRPSRQPPTPRLI
jgi:hypothetical protein